MTALSPEARSPRQRFSTNTEALLKRLQPRDIQMLQAVYVNRAVATRQLAAAFWLQDWANFPNSGLGTPCERRLRLLRGWGLISVTATERTEIVGSWDNPPLVGHLAPWGRSVSITNRGIRALMALGKLPEEIRVEAQEGGPLVYKTAHQIRPKTNAHGHTFLTGGAVLRATHANFEEYTWIGSRDLLKSADQNGKIIPDGLIQTNVAAWAIEGDKATIYSNTLLDRWADQVPRWAAAQAKGLSLPEHTGAPAPLAGVLWYCAGRTPEALRSRVMRLRGEAFEAERGIMFPRTLAWYVDSFDGLAWTYKHFLDPWTRGVGHHPQDLLERRVASAAGKNHPYKLIACLGNLSAWQQVLTWVTEAKLSRKHPPLIALVRDGVEAAQLWSMAHDTDPTGVVLKRMAFLLPPLTDPVVRMDPNVLQWRPDSEAEWQTINLKGLLASFKTLQG